MKICLISFYTRQEDYPNRYGLGILRLKEYLQSFNYDVDLIPIDYYNYSKYDIKSIVDRNYDLVGLSNFSWVNDAINYFDKKLKELNPKLNIVIGGAEVEVMDITKYDNEYFIIGEGELALKNLCDYINNDKEDTCFFENNPNIFNKDHPNHTKLEDKIAIKNPLFTNVSIEDREFLWYETCRGCAFSCGYCGHKTRKKVEYIDLDIIKQEIINIGKMNFKKLFVIDPNFAGYKSRAKIILDYFNTYAPNTEIGLYSRPEFIDDEMIELLKKANISEIRIGIQTINPNVPLWLRSNNLKCIIHELPKLSINNIPWRAELITGLPGDNLEGLKKSIAFVESLNPTLFYSYHLTAIPNTPLYNIKDKFNEPFWITTDMDNRVYESNSYNHSELLEMLDYAKQKENEYNHPKGKVLVK